MTRYSDQEVKEIGRDPVRLRAYFSRAAMLDFAKLVTWASFRRIEPKADDFDMLMLLLRTLCRRLVGCC
jgi:hypothetical protein